MNGVPTRELNVRPRDGDGDDAKEITPEAKSRALAVLHEDLFLMKSQKSIGPVEKDDPSIDEQVVTRNIERVRWVAVVQSGAEGEGEQPMEPGFAFHIWRDRVPSIFRQPRRRFLNRRSYGGAILRGRARQPRL